MIGPRHLSNDDILDLAEQRGNPASRAHLAACPSCAARVDDLRAVLAEARAADVPEPSPLFWEHLSARVSDAVADEAQPGRAAAPVRWLRPAWLVAAATLAAVALVLLVVVRPAPVPPAGPAAAPAVPLAEGLPAGSDDTPGPDVLDEPWALVAALSDELPPDGALAAGLDPVPGSAEQAAETLSAGERDELVRLLEAELARRPL